MWIWLITLALQQTHALVVHGKATSLESGKELYTEIHEITINDGGLNQKISTRYVKPDGQVFATMTSDFSKNKTVPTVLFEDSRFQKKETLEINEATGEVEFKTTIGTKAPVEKNYKLSNEMVAAQGFDNFVKLNFDKIMKKELPLKFGVLSEMDFFSFQGYRKSESSSEQPRFAIRLENFFLRLFSDELLLEYDAISKRIRTYRGLSNLSADDGSSQNVLINYKTVHP